MLNKKRLAGTWPTSFNLSAWAISHGGLTAFLLVLLLAAGAYSLLHIGQKEDPTSPSV